MIFLLLPHNDMHLVGISKVIAICANRCSVPYASDIGTAFKDIESDWLYPSVGMKKPGEHLRVNFGQMPFVYDIDGMVEVWISLVSPVKMMECLLLMIP